MNKRKTIMIDMDDVIVSGGFLYLINKFLGTNYIENDFKSFYMQDIIPNKEEFFEDFITQNQYDHATLNKDVVEVIKQLNNEYDVFIGTAYIFPEIPTKCGHILHQKYDYLIKHLPFIKPHNFVFLSNKSVLNCAIKIDDRLENLNGAKFKLLYTAFHNKDLTKEYLDSKGVIRVDNWKEIGNILISK